MFTHFLIYFSLSSLVSIQAAAPPSLPKNLIDGDRYYQNRGEIKNVHTALKLFNDELSKNKDSWETLWRVSMASYYAGHMTPEDNRDFRKELFRKGRDAGKKCAEITNNSKVQCFFWWATNLALLKETNGFFSIAFGIKDIIKIYEKALKADPTYASSGAYRMLALLHHKAPGFLGGDEKKAYRYIKIAIKNSPNEPLNYYFYGQFLTDDGEEKMAEQVLNNFIKKADPTNFSFFESKTAFKNLLYYLKHKKWLKI